MQKGIVSFCQQFYTSVAALPVSGEEREENKEVQTREPQAEHCEVSSGHVCWLLSCRYSSLLFVTYRCPLHPHSLEIPQEQYLHQEPQ